MIRLRSVAATIALIVLGLGAWYAYQSWSQLVDWFNNHTQAANLIIAVAAGISAVATAAIALANLFLISATRAQARASEATIREVQRDRNLQWSPHLLATRTGDNVRMQNLGRGAAIAAFYCRRETQLKSWRRTERISIPPSGDQTMTLTNEPPATRPPESAFDPDTLEAWFCFDQLGRTLRFGPKRLSADIFDPELSNASQKDWPNWMRLIT